MPAVSPRPRRLLQVTLLVALALSGAPAAYADNCTWNVLAVLGGNWSSNFNCVGPNGSAYPGEKGADTATIAGLNLGATVTVDKALGFPVNLQLSGLLLTPQLSIPSGNKLILDNGSTAPSSATVTVGGTLAVPTGVTIGAFPGNITLSGGTIDDTGSLTLASGASLTLNGGTLQGAGTFGIASGANANFAGNPLAINIGLTFVNPGTLSL